VIVVFSADLPTPSTITSLDREQFVQAAWPIIGRKVAKRRLLEDIYHRAQCSIGLPVGEDSEAAAMFRVLLKEMSRLCRLRQEPEQRGDRYLGENDDFRRLKQIPRHRTYFGPNHPG